MMVSDVNLPLILLAALAATATPGPATLAIAGTSMNLGRKSGLLVASGITSGGLFWSVSAALGLGAIMAANAWLLEIVRYAGASYLLFLAWKSARSALTDKTLEIKTVRGNPVATYSRGLAIHITNPKSILFFGALYSLGVPPDVSAAELLMIIVCVAIQSAIVFHGYALLFSTKIMIQRYMRLRRWFEALFAIGFGVAGFRILTAKLT